MNSKNGPKYHHRRSIRLPGYDYTRLGAYFVTMVTYGRECLFGEISGGEMRLNEFGLLVENEWRRLEKRFGHVVVGDFIVMPNHVHGIAIITEPNSAKPAGHYDFNVEAGEFESGEDAPHNVSNVGAGQETTLPIGHNFLAPPQLHNDPPLQTPPRPQIKSPPLHPRQMPASLGTIIGSFKSTTARLINGLRRTTGTPVWQRNYYERIIRDEKEWTRIHAYIESNPGNWQDDEEYR